MTPPPFLISWNLTRRCNLRCPHCYLDADQLDGGHEDLTTAQALAVVGQLGAFCPGAMLILTGGEPLLRDDLWQIATAASQQGLMVVLGSNGTLLDAQTVPRLVEAGIQGVGVSLDSIHPASHDRFRGLPGAFDRTLSAVDAMNHLGLEFQMQFTVTKSNYDEIPALIELAAEKGARAANVFFLVCTGRGQRMTDITPVQYEKMLRYLAEAETAYAGRTMVRARCAPHFLRLVAGTHPESQVMRGATSGCIAGTGYFRITPEGDVTPCPYMPETMGNLTTQPIEAIWNGQGVIQSLRNPVYNGKCADCGFNQVCGGCRARALSATGDLMGEDPWCDYDPPGRVEGLSNPIHNVPAEWTPAARDRLGTVPFFLRGMVKSGVERYARQKGLAAITPALMIEMRSRVGGKP